MNDSLRRAFSLISNIFLSHSIQNLPVLSLYIPTSLALLPHISPSSSLYIQASFWIYTKDEVGDYLEMAVAESRSDAVGNPKGL